MAEKKQMIVIKKITIAAAGGHGGSWKVAFADFMTAMMAFFLVMWLLGQSDNVKKNVADYFSTPSVLEYHYSNFGVELTLEKLFLDLVNEPLKFFQAFMTPADKTPNIMDMGTKKIVLHYVADQLGDMAEEVEMNQDEITFTVSEKYLFKKGTAELASEFNNVIDKVKQITTGLENSNMYVDSEVDPRTIPGGSNSGARNIAEKRLDIVTKYIDTGLEHGSVDIFGKTGLVKDSKKNKKAEGLVRFRIQQKPETKDGKKPREFEDLFGKADESMSVYDNFVKQISTRTKQTKRPE